jgi:hypothetical protein
MVTNGKKRGRPINEKAKSKFLRIYKELGTVELASKNVPISPHTVYNWIKQDTEFAVSFNDIKPVAKQSYLGALEREAHRRAVEGILEGVFYKGVLVNHIRKFSDVLLIVLLKANAPEKYRENTDLAVHGKDGEPLQTFVFLLPDGTKCTPKDLINAGSNKT